jgi:predicted acylesterase/phospholipase RssA/CRP-like cAMP-binding protein
MDELGADAARVALAPGEVLVREGDQVNAVFVVVSGRFAATTPGSRGQTSVVGHVVAGQVVGEVAAVAGGLRTATLVAMEPTEVVEIERSQFEAWLAERPDVADEISAQARDRIDRIQLVAMFDEILGVTDPELLEDLLSGVSWLRLGAGELLFEQGDQSDAAYFIVGGRLLVTIDDPEGGTRRVRELGRRDVVGELGLLDAAPRSATVRAIRDCTLARFDGDTFESMVTRHPQLMLSVSRSLLARLDHGVRARAPERATAIAVAVTAPGVDVDGLAANIEAETRRYGTVRLLSSDGVDRYLGRQGISQIAVDNVDIPRLAELLHEAEVGSDHVVFLADADVTPWSHRVVRQADRIVLVSSANPGADEQRRLAGFVEQLAGRDHVHRMLAVVHPRSATRPRGTESLAARVGADEVVHVRNGDAGDIARLARLATGHGVGLVLGGGGARGFAHLGVFEALCEVGVPVDAIGSCSIGAPLGAGIAMGLRGDELLEVVERQFHKLLDYTLPVVSLLRGERISSSIRETLSSYSFADLWLPYYCVSTNLTHSRLEVHRRGDLARAVRASVAIPGVLPPVPHDGDLLVDGGVLDNLPVTTMRDDPTIGTVIAVDVAPPSGPKARTDFGLSVSGLRALAGSARGRKDYPSATSVLLRSMLVGAVQNQRHALQDGRVDLLVRLSLPGISLLQFDAVRPVAEAGFEGSIDVVRKWAATTPPWAADHS